MFHRNMWWKKESLRNNRFYMTESLPFSSPNVLSSNTLHKFLFTNILETQGRVYTYGEKFIYSSKPERKVSNIL